MFGTKKDPIKIVVDFDPKTGHVLIKQGTGEIRKTVQELYGEPIALLIEGKVDKIAVAGRAVVGREPLTPKAPPQSDPDARENIRKLGGIN